MLTGTDDVWGNGVGTNIETGCVDALFGVQREWDMLATWFGRNGINGSGGGFPIYIGLNDLNAYWDGTERHDRPQHGRPVDLLAGRRRPRVRPRDRLQHPRRPVRQRRLRGDRRHLRRADRGLRQRARRLRPARLHRRRGDQPRRQRPDPQHVQPVARRRPELLLELDPERRDARRGRPVQPLVLPARRGHQPGRQAGQPDLQRHRRSPASASRTPARSSTTRCCPRRPA